MARYVVDLDVPEFDEIDSLMEDSSRLLDSVYSILRPSPPAHRSPHSSNASSSSGLGLNVSGISLSPKTPRSPKPPRIVPLPRSPPIPTSPSAHEIEAEIHRISRFCEKIDQNLQAVNQRSSPPNKRRTSITTPPPDLQMLGICTPDRSMGYSDIVELSFDVTREPPKRTREKPPIHTETEGFIDLSDSECIPLPVRFDAVAAQNEDDVILVTPSVECNDVIDLSTPTQQPPIARRRTGISRRRTSNNSNGGRSVRSIVCQRGSSSTSGISTTQRSHSTCAALPPDDSLSRNSVHTSTTNILKNTDDSEGSKACASPNSWSSRGERTPFMCAVCMESCINNEPTSTKCGHVFCARCIREAIRMTHKCPMCNTKLTNRMMFRIYV